MNKYLQIVWLIATVTSWLSFGFASWQWADGFNRGMFVLTLLWFIISLVLFMIGFWFRKSSS
ncbi:MAG TPA: hypothetical protein VK900_02010 [Anaerolineales bacterium]|nr:hypothetical protein [Anaerolineales bacterium]